MAGVLKKFWDFRHWEGRAKRGPGGERSTRPAGRSAPAVARGAGSLTVGHGARKHEGGGAAAHGVRRVVARVDVDPVLGEMAQAAQHRSLSGHFVLLDLEIGAVSPGSEGVCGAPVPPGVPGEGGSQGPAPATPLSLGPAPAHLCGLLLTDVTFQGDLGRPGRAPSRPREPPRLRQRSASSPARQARPAPRPTALGDGDGVVQEVFKLLLERGLLRLQRWQDLPRRRVLARAAAGLRLRLQVAVFAVEARVAAAGGQPQAWRGGGGQGSS